MPDATPPQRRVEIDERWIGTWVNLGLTELRRYLERYAAFERWLHEHGRD